MGFLLAFYVHLLKKMGSEHEINEFAYIAETQKSFEEATISVLKAVEKKEGLFSKSMISKKGWRPKDSAEKDIQEIIDAAR